MDYFEKLSRTISPDMQVGICFFLRKLLVSQQYYIISTMYPLALAPHRINHPYHDYRKNDINDYRLQSCIFANVEELQIAGRSRLFSLPKRCKLCPNMDIQHFHDIYWAGNSSIRPRKSIWWAIKKSLCCSIWEWRAVIHWLKRSGCREGWPFRAVSIRLIMKWRK